MKGIKSYNKSEAGKILGISVSSINKIIRQGYIEYIRHPPSGLIRFTDTQINKYINDNSFSIPSLERTLGECLNDIQKKQKSILRRIDDLQDYWLNTQIIIDDMKKLKEEIANVKHRSKN